MSRGGFALLAVLWVIAALAGIVGLGVGLMRVESLGSSNRLRLERARWSAEACLAIAQARWVEHSMPDTATIDLGRTTACRWRVDDPTARVNANTAPAAMLVSLGLPVAVAESLVAHRPYQDTAELRSRLGPDSGLESLLTVDGPGTVDLNAASPAVLRAIPGVGSEAAERLAEFVRLGRPVSSLDQLVSVATGERSALLAHYADLSSLVTFAPAQLVITATGQVGGEEPHATVEELVVPLPDRLAVIRRRLW
ncbi:MAG TPA: helix-hairpin-helix domain-containing protein [bacterium]|nr:helix-hairpin-helix domain-containing protein [bacterium]